MKPQRLDVAEPPRARLPEYRRRAVVVVNLAHSLAAQLAEEVSGSALDEPDAESSDCCIRPLLDVFLQIAVELLDDLLGYALGEDVSA